VGVAGGHRQQLWGLGTKAPKFLRIDLMRIYIPTLNSYNEILLGTYPFSRVSFRMILSNLE